MRRRDFLKVASGAVGGAAVAGEAAAAGDPSGSAVAQQSTPAGDGTTAADGTTSGGGGLPGAGTEKTVAVGPGGDFVFDPETVYVQPGTTVVWEWESDFHNIVVDAQPDGANWEGTAGGAGTTYDTGHVYEFQFTETGTYEYYCDPHLQQGMVGSVVVNESGQAPESEGGGELSPHEMGVPFQAHFVGIATVLMMVVSVVYTFFVLKYGESPHASAPKE